MLRALRLRAFFAKDCVHDLDAWASSHEYIRLTQDSRNEDWLPCEMIGPMPRDPATQPRLDLFKLALAPDIAVVPAILG